MIARNAPDWSPAILSRGSVVRGRSLAADVNRIFSRGRGKWTFGGGGPSVWTPPAPGPRVPAPSPVIGDSRLSISARHPQ